MNNFLSNIEHHAYLFGYKGRILPRFIRKIFARSGLHKSWLAGHMGAFIDVCSGSASSVTDWNVYQFRK